MKHSLIIMPPTGETIYVDVHRKPSPHRRPRFTLLKVLLLLLVISIVTGFFTQFFQN